MQNKTHGLIAGIFIGSKEMFRKALRLANPTDRHFIPVTVQELFDAATVKTFAQATTDLTGWTPNASTDVLVRSFLDERSYFKYKSLFLVQPLSEDGQAILRDYAVVCGEEEECGTGTNFTVVFEFQAMGGDPSAQLPGGNAAGLFDDGSTFTYKFAPNNFSRIPVESTAFPQRNALHCLMLKANSATEEGGDVAFAQMENVYNMLLQTEQVQNGIQSEGREGQPVVSYVNHIDANLPEAEFAQFYAGVNSLKSASAFWTPSPSLAELSTDFWINKLKQVRCKYNPDGLLYVNPLLAGLAGGPCTNDVVSQCSVRTDGEECAIGGLGTCSCPVAGRQMLFSTRPVDQCECVPRHSEPFP